MCCPPLPTVAFRVYDADDDGFVTRADLLRQMQQTNRRGLSAGQLEEIVSSTVRTFIPWQALPGGQWHGVLCAGLGFPADRSSLVCERCRGNWFPCPPQVATFDADGDGQLCYEEFRVLLCDSATQQALKF